MLHLIGLSIMYTLQKVDQSGKYEKLLDFTHRLKFQQIINHLYVHLH